MKPQTTSPRNQWLSLVTVSLFLAWGSLCVSAADTVAITHANVYTSAKPSLIEDATILIVDGRISEIGTQVAIPLNARIINASGKWVIPGIVDPYYVVRLAAEPQEEVRTVVFQGRSIPIGGGSPAARTTLLNIAEVFDTNNANWNQAIRSGITTMHLVSSGYCYTAVARPIAGSAGETFLQKNSHLHVAATNSAQSLGLIRSGLEKPADGRSGGPPGGGSRSAGRPSAGSPTTTGAPLVDQDPLDDEDPLDDQYLDYLLERDPSEGDWNSELQDSGSSPESQRPSPAAVENRNADTRKAWEEIRAGKHPLFVNAENSAAILHVARLREKADQSAIVITATGPNLYQALDALKAPRTTVVLAPEINEIPNSAVRINVPLILQQENIPFAISLSAAASQFRRNQDSPLFPLAMLVKTGLSKESALESITINSATAIGLDSVIGSLEKGKYGNLVIFNDDPLATYARIHQVVVEGRVVEAR